MRRVFCKAKESFARKGFFGRCALPFASLLPPSNGKTEFGEKGSIKVGDFGEAAHTQIDMAKRIFGHLIFWKLGSSLTSYLIFL
jgi:hypothetical protein